MKLYISITLQPVTDFDQVQKLIFIKQLTFTNIQFDHLILFKKKDMDTLQKTVLYCCKN